MAYIRSERLEQCLDGFLMACHVIKKDFENGHSFIGTPLVVNAAFAAELSLKRLIERATGKPVKGHKLKELWDQIDPAVQAKVVPLVCVPIPLDVSRFDEYLDKCSTTFVDWRYMYEKSDNFSNYLFLLNLATELRRH